MKAVSTGLPMRAVFVEVGLFPNLAWETVAFGLQQKGRHLQKVGVQVRETMCNTDMGMHGGTTRRRI